MMFLVRMLMRRGRGQAMDPLQVAMTGVRMGERFLQIGCSDRALLAGLASKVGLSGTAAVAAFDHEQVKLVDSIAARVGALIEVRDIDGGREWPFGASEFDMVVVDDTDDRFFGLDKPNDILKKALDSLRPGGRIEIVTPVKSAHGQFDYRQLLSEAGFKPVRVLAERGRLRFVEGLRAQS
jgi:SAM-dependent methyltransferase